MFCKYVLLISSDSVPKNKFLFYLTAKFYKEVSKLSSNAKPYFMIFITLPNIVMLQSS